MERRSAESKDAFTCPPERFSISAAAREQKALDRSLQGGNIFSNGDQDVQSESSVYVMGMNTSARLASDRLKRMASRALKGIARSVQLGSGRCLGYARWKVTTKRAPQMENNAHLDRRPQQGLDLSLSSSVQSFTGPDLGVQSWASEFRNQQYIMHAKPFRKRFNDLKKKKEFHWIDFLFDRLLMNCLFSVCQFFFWAHFLWVNWNCPSVIISKRLTNLHCWAFWRSCILMRTEVFFWRRRTEGFISEMEKIRSSHFNYLKTANNLHCSERSTS